MSRYEQQWFEYLNAFKRDIMMQPLMLGGAWGSGGGIGGRPGGFIGYLPQTRVAYDTDEFATLATTLSGSLLDNLNHIRYRIQTLESSSGAGASISVYQNGTEVETNVTILDFAGGVNVTNPTVGRVLVTVSGALLHNQFLFSIEGGIAFSGVSDNGTRPLRIAVHDVGSVAVIDEVYLTLNQVPASGVRINILKNGSTVFQAPTYVEITGYEASRTTNFTNNTITKNDILQAQLIQADDNASDLVIHVRYNYVP